MNSALEVQGLSKYYKDFALKNVSLSLPMGYIMGLIGPNGSGKTTTIKAILNMVKVDSGNVTVFGKDNIAKEREIKKEVGVVLDNSYFVDDWTIKDAEKAFQLFYETWDSGKFWSLIEKFRITKEKKVKELSKGMQMKLMLACAFSYDAKLLILDEPTSGLDPVSRDELLEILSGYIGDEQHSVLFSTHITSDLEKIADYITYINLGDLVFTGSKEEFIDGYRVVSGEPDALPDSLKAKLIGLRTFSTGYEALIHTKDIPANEPIDHAYATIDDIVVFMGRQAEIDGRILK